MGVRPRTVRMALVLTGIAALLVGTVGLGRSAPAPVPAPSRLHIGPVSVEQDQRVVLAATNLGDEARKARLRLIDEDGEPVASKRTVVPPGATRLLGATIETSRISVMRGFLLGDGSVRRWKFGLSIVDGTSNTLAFWEHLIDLSLLSSARSSTAAAQVGSGNEVAVHVANLGRGAADFGVRLLDRAGDVVDTAELSDVQRGATETVTFGFTEPTAVRAIVSSSDGARYVASGEVRGPTGIVGFPEFDPKS